MQVVASLLMTTSK